MGIGAPLMRSTARFTNESILKCVDAIIIVMERLVADSYHVTVSFLGNK